MLAGACCFCDWDEALKLHTAEISPQQDIVVTLAQFRRHLGSHMVQLALFALPRQSENDDDVDSNEPAVRSDSRKSSVDTVREPTKSSDLSTYPADSDLPSESEYADPVHTADSDADAQWRMIEQDLARWEKDLIRRERQHDIRVSTWQDNHPPNYLSQEEKEIEEKEIRQEIQKEIRRRNMEREKPELGDDDSQNVKQIQWQSGEEGTPQLKKKSEEVEESQEFHAIRLPVIHNSQ